MKKYQVEYACGCIIKKDGRRYPKRCHKHNAIWLYKTIACKKCGTLFSIPIGSKKKHCNNCKPYCYNPDFYIDWDLLKEKRKKIQEIIRKKLIECNISQSELARKMNVSRQFIFIILNGKRGFSQTTLDKFNKALNLELKYEKYSKKNTNSYKSEILTEF